MQEPAELMRLILATTINVYQDTSTVADSLRRSIGRGREAWRDRSALLRYGIKFHRFRSPVLWFDGRECLLFIPAIIATDLIVEPEWQNRERIFRVLCEIRGAIPENRQIEHLGQLSTRRVVAIDAETVRGFLDPPEPSNA